MPSSAIPDSPDSPVTYLATTSSPCCRDNPDDALSRTEYAEAALYTVNALQMFERTRREEQPADCYLGHSLGEYNALLAAGVFDFETGLRLVKKRGELMAAASGGGMTAVMDTPAPRDCSTSSGRGRRRRPGHRGHRHQRAARHRRSGQGASAPPTPRFKERGIRFAPLRVSATVPLPLHGAGPRGVRADTSREFTFAEPAAEVVANVSGRPYEKGAIVATLSQQLVEPVRWTDSVRHLLARDPRFACEEVGGKSLLRMVEKIVRPQYPPRPRPRNQGPDMSRTETRSQQYIIEEQLSGRVRRRPGRPTPSTSRPVSSTPSAISSSSNFPGGRVRDSRWKTRPISSPMSSSPSPRSTTSWPRKLAEPNPR